MKNDRKFLQKFVVTVAVVFVLLFSTMPCAQANGGMPPSPCSGSTKNIRECLAKALGCKATSRDVVCIQKVLGLPFMHSTIALPPPVTRVSLTGSAAK